MMTLQRQQRTLQDLFDIFQQKSKTIAQIDQILLNPMQFHGVKEDVLRKGKKQLEKELISITESAIKYANNLQDIRVDSSDFPPISLALPSRRLIELKSGLGLDYTKLSDLLFAKKWGEADLETQKLMLKCANRKKEDWLDLDSCRKFPSKELRMIDQLWLKYSDNKFGFSVQKEIWINNGGKLDGSYDSDTYCKLRETVNWGELSQSYLSQSYSDTYITFNINELRGHYPAHVLWGIGGWVEPFNSFLFSKL